MQVAERLVGCMGNPQLARLATVAFLDAGVAAEAVSRIVGAVQLAAPEMGVADAARLADAVAVTAHRDGGAIVAMALATRLMACRHGATAAQSDAALQQLQASGFLLPLEVQARFGGTSSRGRFQLRHVMAEVAQLDVRGAPPQRAQQ